MLGNILLCVTIGLFLVIICLLLLLLYMPVVSRKTYMDCGDGEKAQQPKRRSTNLSWYFSRSALPYWCMLFLDSVIVVYSCLLGVYLGDGGQLLVPNFWPYLWSAVISLPLFYVGMLIFRTYKRVISRTIWGNLWRVSCAVLVGMALMKLLRHFLNYSWYASGISGHMQIVMLLSAILFMWLVRVLIKLLYESFVQMLKNTKEDISKI